MAKFTEEDCKDLIVIVGGIVSFLGAIWFGLVKFLGWLGSGRSFGDNDFLHLGLALACILFLFLAGVYFEPDFPMADEDPSP